MKAVYCFSGTGHSRAVAEFFAQKLCCDVIAIDNAAGKLNAACDVAVVVFPVYSQNVPLPVRDFLRSFDAESVALIATFGRMHCGNVLREAKRLLKGQVIAGVCVPTGHTYLSEDCSFDSDALAKVLARIERPAPAHIPRMHKQLMAYILPGLRSRIGVRLKRTENCMRCGLCDTVCPMHAMHSGTPDHRCIRCLRCSAVCPHGALKFSLHPALRGYLSKTRDSSLHIYL